MKIVHITAGAGGRLCGSCLHDNTLVRALRKRGRDAILVPAYVPTTTDDENIAEPIVFMGGINVYLQQSLSFFRYTPQWFDRLLDHPRLLRWLSGKTGRTRAADLGPLTVSSLQGELGYQRKEVDHLADWLGEVVQPDVVHLSNVLLLGLARRIRERSGAAIVASLSGEDFFIEQLPSPHRETVWQLLADRAVDADCFVALNQAYADRMARKMSCQPDRITVIPHGIEPAGFAADLGNRLVRQAGRRSRWTIGFLARACREKGLDQAIQAVAQLIRRGRDVELLAAGAVVPAEADYLKECRALVKEQGLTDRFRWLGQVDWAGKQELFKQTDVFVMPTPVPEAKGIPVIEAMAAGLPVVAPHAGAFPELLEANSSSPCGLLHDVADPVDLARAIAELLDNPDRLVACSKAAFSRARRCHTSDQMAASHEQLYARLRER